MSELSSDLRRIVSSSGLYALASLFQRGLSFLLLPIYTRFLLPADYGVLELLTALSSILFGLLLLGLPSALTKVLHRDCKTDADRAAALPTALMLDLPLLLLGGGALLLWAEPIGRLLIGEPGRASEIRLTVATVLLASLIDIVLAGFRARERAWSFVALNLAQFGLAMTLNLMLVVGFELGIHGVLWGNLIAATAALPLGLWLARADLVPRFEKRLAMPLLTFGILVVPSALTGWIMALSDRYILRSYGALEEVAVYAVGYKIGMILQMAVVWPFQLAWPTVAFSISRRIDHQATFARVMTYLAVLLLLGTLALGLLAKVGLTRFAGPSYDAATQVVPWIALAYAFSGLQFCLSPALHIAGRTRLVPQLSLLAALVNLGLNFLLVPTFGMLGSTWATTAAYLCQLVLTAFYAQRLHPVEHEIGRLLRVAGLGAAVFALGWIYCPEGLIRGLVWQSLLVFGLFPALLLASGFLAVDERAKIAGTLDRLRKNWA
jgi:O-antigen/teichoic acid export membrane protein